MVEASDCESWCVICNHTFKAADTKGLTELEIKHYRQSRSLDFHRCYGFMQLDQNGNSSTRVYIDGKLAEENYQTYTAITNNHSPNSQTTNPLQEEYI